LCFVSFRFPCRLFYYALQNAARSEENQKIGRNAECSGCSGRAAGRLVAYVASVERGDVASVERGDVASVAYVASVETWSVAYVSSVERGLRLQRGQRGAWSARKKAAPDNRCDLHNRLASHAAPPFRATVIIASVRSSAIRSAGTA
jgi:hypothetical protein